VLSSDGELSFDHSLFDKAVATIYDKKDFTASMLTDPAVRDLLDETYRVFHKALDRGLIHEVPEQLTSSLEQNVFIFSGFKTYNELKEVSLLLKGEDGGFKSFEKFKEDVLSIDNTYNRSYLQAEYNYAVQSTQMAVKWNDFQQDADHYDLQYRTAGDDKVREEHQALDGTTLPVNDPFWDSYLPPLDWNCRCTTVQVLKDKYPVSNSKDSIAKGEAATAKPKQKMFRFNPGKELKIFPNKHPYYKSAENKLIRKKIDQLQPEQFETIPTDKGKVRISNKQQKHERQENIDIATKLANEYGYSIDLIGIKPNQKTPDSYNKTLGIFQEYKVSKTNTLSSVERLLRSGYHQADNVVLQLKIKDKKGLANKIKCRVERTDNAKTLHLIINNQHIKYTREEILKEGFEIQYE
jgi:phage putative head morphogenesis protein, SPP1 gp7 family